MRIGRVDRNPRDQQLLAFFCSNHPRLTQSIKFEFLVHPQRYVVFDMRSPTELSHVFLKKSMSTIHIIFELSLFIHDFLSTLFVATIRPNRGEEAVF